MAKRQQKPRKRKYNIGDLVYFHAFADPKVEYSYFLCKGYIVRQPITNSPVYKVVVTSVDPKSVLCGEQPDIAKELLGRRIARTPEQITPEPTGFMSKLYEGVGWLDINSAELKKIKEMVRRKKK